MPQPAFVPEMIKPNEKAGGPSKEQVETRGDDIQMIEDSKPRGRPSSEETSLVGPWDRSRSFREGEKSIGCILQPPAVAASLLRP